MFTLPMSRRALLACVGLALAPCLATADDKDKEVESGWSHDFYEAHTLVSDGSVPADVPDDHLKNGWGVAFNPQGFVWVADNHTGLSTLYDGKGAIGPLVVKIPAAPGETQGSPTGIVFSAGADFIVKGTTAAGADASGPARFLFASEDGVISGWAPNVNTATAFIAKDNSPAHAIYKGIALGGDGTRHLLYAADFHNGRIDVWDGTFTPVTLPAGAFKDPYIPHGYGPFNIQAVNGDLVVTYAKQDDAKEDEIAGRGFGFVNIYDPNGKLIQRFAARGALNAPWGIALAPSSFGRFGGALLIGNFGDGTINAYGPISGHFLGALRDKQGRRIKIDGLWGIQFGNGLMSQQTNALFAAAGPGDEEGGSYSVIRAH
jgi:uncharacterized protein (TIGR03118 family)